MIAQALAQSAPESMARPVDVASLTRVRVRREPRLALIVAGLALWMLQPVGNQTVIVIAYALVLLGSALKWSRSGFQLDKRVLWWSIPTLWIGAISVTIGFLHSNPGARSEAVFFVGLPAVWLLLMAGIDERAIRALVNIIPLASLVIGVLGFSYWLDATGRYHAPWVQLVDLGQGIGTQQFGSALRFYPISTLVFVVPFLAVSLILPDVYTWRISQRLAAPALLSVLGLMFVAGRRILFISPILAVVITYVLLVGGAPAAGTRRRIMRWALVMTVGAITLGVFTGLSIPNLVLSIFGSNGDNIVRIQSGSALLSAWAHSPLIGHGLGTTVAGAVRSNDRPWNFELQYLLILNAMGVVGLLVLSHITLSMLRTVRRAILAERTVVAYMVPIFAGAVSLIAANATDPYMHTPGHYWMFFLLPAGYNAIRCRQAQDEAKQRDLQMGRVLTADRSTQVHDTVPEPPPLHDKGNDPQPARPPVADTRPEQGRQTEAQGHGYHRRRRRFSFRTPVAFCLGTVLLLLWFHYGTLRRIG